MPNTKQVHDMLNLDGLKIALTGGIPHRRRAEVEAKIRAAGGVVVSRVTAATGVLMVGHGGAAGVLADAQAHGVTTITPDQLLTLVREGQLSIGEDAEPESLGDVVADLRAAFDGSPSPAMWREVVRLLDVCEGARLADAVSYVEASVSGWPVDAGRARWASMFQYGFSEGGHYVGGDMRVAPLEWVNAMLDGEERAVFSLPRALSLRGTKAKTKRAKMLFDVEALSDNLRVLDLGRDIDLTKTFLKALAKAQNLKGVDTLIYFAGPAGSGENLAAQTSMPNLRALHFRAGNLDYDASLSNASAMLGADWAAQLELIESSFGINQYASGSATAMHAVKEHSDRLLGLKHLVLTNGLNDDLLDASYADRLESITLHLRYPGSITRTFESLAARAPSNLVLIDLSQAFALSGRYPFEEYAEALWGVREAVERLGARVRLGEGAPQRARDAVGDLLDG